MANNGTRKMGGGKRSKKGTKKSSPWIKFVMGVWADLKKSKKGASFGDAMKEASKRKRR